jgi:AraC-like DNA-binding protein
MAPIWKPFRNRGFFFLHYHAMLEIGVCAKGSGIFNVDNGIYPFVGPCLSIILPNQIHSAQSTPGDPSSWHFLYLSLENLYSGSRAQLSVESLWRVIEGKTFSPILPREGNEELYGLANLIIDEAAGEKSDRVDVVASLLVSFLLLLKRRCQGKRKKEGKDIDSFSKIQPAISYLSAHFDKEISIKGLARLCFLSESSFRRFFFSYAERTPYQYVNDLRLNTAKMMLAQKDNRILDIALECGFSSLSSFNRAFKKKFQQTPREIKKEISRS